MVHTSLLGLRAAVVPKWLAWLGFIVAATMLVAFIFLPFLIFLGWVLAVSVVLIWRERVALPSNIEP